MKDSYKYYKDVKKLFPINGKQEKIYLTHLKQQIDEYGDVSYNDLEEIFGNPNQIYASYIESLDEDEVISKMNYKKLLKRLFITCIICVLVLSLFIFYKINQEADEAKKHRVDEIENIIEEK